MRLRVEILIDEQEKAEELLRLLTGALLTERGEIKDVKVYDRELGPEEVAEDYQQAQESQAQESAEEETEETLVEVEEDLTDEAEESTNTEGEGEETALQTEDVVKPECFGYFDADDPDCVGDPSRGIEPCLFLEECREAREKRNNSNGDQSVSSSQVGGEDSDEEGGLSDVPMDRDGIVADVRLALGDLIDKLEREGVLRIAEGKSATSFFLGSRVAFFVKDGTKQKVRIKGGWLERVGVDLSKLKKGTPPGFYKFDYASQRDEVLSYLRRILEKACEEFK